MKVWQLIKLLELQPRDAEINTPLGWNSWIGEECDVSHGPLWVGKVNGKVRVGIDCSEKRNLPYRTFKGDQIVEVDEYYKR